MLIDNEYRLMITVVIKKCQLKNLPGWRIGAYDDFRPFRVILSVIFKSYPRTVDVISGNTDFLCFFKSWSWYCGSIIINITILTNTLYITAQSSAFSNNPFKSQAALKINHLVVSLLLILPSTSNGLGVGPEVGPEVGPGVGVGSGVDNLTNPRVDDPWHLLNPHSLHMLVKTLLLKSVFLPSTRHKHHIYKEQFHFRNSWTSQWSFQWIHQ